MSDTAVASDLFTPLTEDQWAAEGASGAAERGLYGLVLTSFAASGQRHAMITTDRGRFAGKKAQSVATALKNTQNGKNAPEGVGHIKITSRGENKEKGVKGAIFLENPNVASTASDES
jgi:hypothetical protein